MNGLSPFWGFEFIRQAAQAGRWGRIVSTISTFVAGLTVLVLGVRDSAWGLTIVGVLLVGVAVTWVVLAYRAMRDADRLQRRTR
jgi:uncharacterized membrane protein HdeD (DUF308 family)